MNIPSVPVGPKPSTTSLVSRNGTVSGVLSNCIYIKTGYHVYRSDKN